MALPSTGAISINDIATEFNCNPNLYDCAVAAGLSTSNISMDAFHGLSSNIVLNLSTTDFGYGYISNVSINFNLDRTFVQTSDRNTSGTWCDSATTAGKTLSFRVRNNAGVTGLFGNWQDQNGLHSGTDAYFNSWRTITLGYSSTVAFIITYSRYLSNSTAYAYVDLSTDGGNTYVTGIIEVFYE